MPIIPAQPHVEQKDTLSLRLEHEVHERLKQYAEFIKSPKDYVIGQALRRLFRKDKDFTVWVESRPNGHHRASTDDTSDVVTVATADGALTVGDLSVSVGGASFPDDAADLDGLLEVADSALYAAKRSGRNAVRMGLHVHATQQLSQPWADADGSCASPAKRPIGESAEPAQRPSPRH